ncbi:MAG TPA: ATP-binding protein, partial [Bacilli bacterium]
IPKIQLEALARNFTLICEYPSREANLLVHAAYLQKVLDEIILNSFEASQPNSSIHIRTEISDQFIVFSITDHGSGIPEALLSLVLAPFFTTKDESLGLGLSFCDIMITKMEGHLDIQSSNGLTTVMVTLPHIGHFLN